MGNIAREIGTPLMAWQQYVADVALEQKPDGSLAYREVIVSVPRQNGKTQLVLTAMCARCLLWGREQRVAYTAQTGKAARSKFKDDHKPLIERSDLSHLVRRFYMSDGNTSMIWENDSRINVLDNSPESGHGMTLDLAIIDEAFEAKDNLREQALLPTMATRQDPQIWNVSTAGTADSSYLLRKTEIGRAAVNAGSTEGVAYFEWAIPEDEDIDDPGVWAERMPAYGVTIHDEYIRHARQTMPEGEFRRAIGNQWTEAEERLIPGEFWRQVVDASGSVGDGFWFATDARTDRSAAVVVAGDSSGRVELAEYGPDVSWLVSWLVERGRQVVIDRTGPLANVGDELVRRGVQVLRVDSLGVRKACGTFFDGVMDGVVSVGHSDLVEDAVRHAARKSQADSWAWHREVPGGEILVALSLAFASQPTDALSQIW